LHLQYTRCKRQPDVGRNAYPTPTSLIFATTTARCAVAVFDAWAAAKPAAQANLKGERMNEIQQYIVTRTICLDHEQLLLLEGKPGTRLRVIHGGIWLTTDNELRDQFPRTGDEVVIKAHRRSIIESIGKSTIELLEPLRGGTLKRLVAALRRRLPAEQAL